MTFCFDDLDVASGGAHPSRIIGFDSKRNDGEESTRAWQGNNCRLQRGCKQTRDLRKEELMTYRTRKYIAADWDGDNNLIDTLQAWNESEYWSLSFPDAHELTQARDTSKACSAKRSLHTRLDASKTFV